MCQQVKEGNHEFVAKASGGVARHKSRTVPAPFPLRFRRRESGGDQPQVIGVERPAWQLDRATEEALWHLLQHGMCQRLAIEFAGQHRLVLHAMAQQPIHAVVSQHTLDQVLVYCARYRLPVQTWPLPDGAMHLIIHASARADDAVHLHVQLDGSVAVPVNGAGQWQASTCVQVLAEKIVAS